MTPLPFDEGLSETLAAFRVHGVGAGHSSRTMDSREATVRRLGLSHNVFTVDAVTVLEWLAALSIGRSSRGTYRTHLRVFFAWMVKTGRREDNPADDLPVVRTPRGIPHPVTPDEVGRMLAACSDQRAATTRAYILLAAYEGLRVHEVAKVRGEDFANGQVFVRGKGGTESSVPLHPKVAELVPLMPSAGWWFPTNGPEGHVSRVSVSLAISRAMRRAGVAGTPHGLRHHFGTQVLRTTGDLRTTQRALRHASPATTAVYTQVADDTLFRAVAGIPAA